MANNGKVKTENIVLEYTANTKDVVEQVGKVTKSLEQLHNEIEKLNNLKICIEIETTTIRASEIPLFRWVKRMWAKLIKEYAL